MSDTFRFPFSPDPLPAGTRIACRIEYDGSCFNGWQSQPHPGTVTVQQTLERAISAVAAAPVRVHCAGRTDTGVHGHAQIVHFDAPTVRSCKAWVLGVNAELPAAVRVHWALPVAADFHARFSALSRRYRYLIANTPVRPALMGRQLSWYRRPLDAARMHIAAQALLGEQDFSAFRAASCQSESPNRHVSALSVWRRGELVIIDIEANAFLHHMVRNIAGSLMAVGDGRREPDWIGQLLAGRDRALAADTAAPDGLYLVDVAYPPHYGLPPTPEGPLLLAL
ncbi:tRNA pseudouridine(38-40) synthase TruA [Kineobactrum salinum]|uniref:tRNA pseudouridine synthase A n=1 Tax=Kineobactrum salinum TaxID=2708301 RepID=A0A6C0U5M7_9GAMM|nr:tRNA pseudouridine(38-40) synthase TruA [Kineobactrum salinum]QIB67276.1 tRNA pseudouridine(38-40) synthase TruA [Kineobactrum salinum]